MINIKNIILMFAVVSASLNKANFYYYSCCLLSSNKAKLDRISRLCARIERDANGWYVSTRIHFGVNYRGVEIRGSMTIDPYGNIVSEFYRRKHGLKPQQLKKRLVGLIAEFQDPNSPLSTDPYMQILKSFFHRLSTSTDVVNEFLNIRELFS